MEMPDTPERTDKAAGFDDGFPNPTPDEGSAERAFGAFVDSARKDRKITALHDSDGDGVAAGVVWEIGMKRLGFKSVRRVIPDRERNAWTEANRRLVRQTDPGALFVLDLGSQPDAVLPGVPTCFIDHHRPGNGIPAGDTLISAYTWEPIPNTSLIVWNLLNALTTVSDIDWIAAIGICSDLGERAPFPLMEAAKRNYTAKYLKEATALINAARRASEYAPERAARALLTHDSPKSLVNSTSEDVQQLRSAREEVKAALDEAKQAPPIFAGKAALIRVHSRCQVHPLIAQIWRTRLPGYMVICANTQYMPGRVNFSARSAGEQNVLAYLRGLQIPEGEGNYGNGHDQASGGSLPIARWNALLEQIGFPPEVFETNSD